MGNKYHYTFLLAFPFCGQALAQSIPVLTPITERVNVQRDTARHFQVINGEWVAIGSPKPHALQQDAGLLFNGKPSYRFELKQEDNQLQGYEEGSTKGRVELSYIYATHEDYRLLPPATFQLDQAMKDVYSRGKGQCRQGSGWRYSFSIYVPSALSPDINAIFAQWHGMPSRTLIQDAGGNIRLLSPEQFRALTDTVLFKNDRGYSKVPMEGGKSFKVGAPNGWKVEQGGYPPLELGFSNGFFHITASSDCSWLTDKTDRNHANPARDAVMRPVASKAGFKTSTIAYKIPFEDFPKTTWVTFDLDIDWTVYGREQNKVLKPGRLNVAMRYMKNNREVKAHIVNNREILIGRNDEHGYYFKMGIYRTGSSIVPVTYNLAGFSQQQLH